MAYPISFEKFMTSLTKMEECRIIMDQFLSAYDVFVCPVHTTSAYKHIQPDSHFGPFSLYKQDFLVDAEPLSYMHANSAYTTLFNLTGNPVVVMPVGYTKENLPIGIQVVGPRWHDMELLTVSGQLDKIADVYKRPPGF
jgi:amidase